MTSWSTSNWSSFMQTTSSTMAYCLYNGHRWEKPALRDRKRVEAVCHQCASRQMRIIQFRLPWHVSTYHEVLRLP